MRDDDGSMEEFARITTPFVKDKIERRFRMSKEEKHLQTKIRIFEDMLLRCKNFGQAEAIQIELTRMRAKLKNCISREWSPNKGSFFFIVWRTIFKGMGRMVKNQKKPLVAASRDELLCVALPVIHRLFGVFILQKENQVLG